MYYLHTGCWVLNMFGIFFILAAHEHYSIDVVIAFYISSRLFLYYHTLANTRALKRIDSKRTRVWFPLFWFFEEKVSGKVPNEYEWPLKWPSFLCTKPKSQWEVSCRCLSTFLRVHFSVSDTSRWDFDIWAIYSQSTSQVTSIFEIWTEFWNLHASFEHCLVNEISDFL